MKQYSIIEDNIIGTLKEMFPQIELNAMRFDFMGNVSVFFVRFNDLETFTKEWKEFSYAIGVNFQSKMEDEFSRWNIYIIYVAKENVPITLKYEIENDKLATRKIVEENCNLKIDEESMIRFIDKHIVNSDIKLNAKKKDSEASFTNDSKIWKLVTSYSEKPLKGKPEEATQVLNSIEKILKDED